MNHLYPRPDRPASPDRPAASTGFAAGRTFPRERPVLPHRTRSTLPMTVRSSAGTPTQHPVEQASLHSSGRRPGGSRTCEPRSIRSSSDGSRSRSVNPRWAACWSS